MKAAAAAARSRSTPPFKGDPRTPRSRRVRRAWAGGAQGTPAATGEDRPARAALGGALRDLVPRGCLGIGGAPSRPGLRPHRAPAPRGTPTAAPQPAPRPWKSRKKPRKPDAGTHALYGLLASSRLPRARVRASSRTGVAPRRSSSARPARREGESGRRRDASGAALVGRAGPWSGPAGGGAGARPPGGGGWLRGHRGEWTLGSSCDSARDVDVVFPLHGAESRSGRAACWRDQARRRRRGAPWRRRAGRPGPGLPQAPTCCEEPAAAGAAGRAALGLAGPAADGAGASGRNQRYQVRLAAGPGCASRCPQLGRGRVSQPLCPREGSGAKDLS